MNRNRLIGALGAILLTLGTGGTARADFADPEIGARGLAMGGAFVAVDGDPASLFWNPAAILSTRRVQVSAMRTRLFDGIEGLNEDFIGLTASVREDLGLAFGWTRVGLEDIYNEDVLSAGLAWRVLDSRLTVGAALLFFGADAPGYEALNDPHYLGRQWESSGSVGALYRVTDALQFGLSLENLLRPEISLLSNSGDVDQIGGRRRVGVAYVVQEIVRVTGEIRHHDFPGYYDSDWTIHAGAESWFGGVLALRVGVDDGDLTAGFGLLVDRLRFDGGLVTNERLGNTFRAAITVGF